MPVYTYIKQDQTIIEKLFKPQNIPEQIVCEDGEIAKRQITSCNFVEKINITAMLDNKKRMEEDKHYRTKYNVEQFNPLKGQSQETAREDFEKVKNKLSEQMLEKQQIRQKNNIKKRAQQKKTYNETARLYFKGQEERKERQFEEKKISV